MKKGSFLKWMGIGLTAGIGIAILAELQKISEISKKQVELMTQPIEPNEEEHIPDQDHVPVCDIEEQRNDESLMD
jgi:hypothetical protein